MWWHTIVLHSNLKETSTQNLAMSRCWLSLILEAQIKQDCVLWWLWQSK
jgi:hypothetical protein